MRLSVISSLLFVGSLAVVLPACESANANGTSSKDVVIQYITQLAAGDATAVDRYVDPNYVQHSPGLPNGAPRDLVANLPPGFKYEMGLVVAEGPLVMVHGRYTGFGPKPSIAVDIFRVKDGKLVEHWDVLQDEVPASQTASGNPMFDPSEK